MLKKILPVLIALGFVAVLYFFFFRSSSNAQTHARRFCECSTEMGRAEVRKKAERIDEAEYQQLRQAHIQCMGTDDPRAKLSAAQKEQFDIDFLIEIKRQCPDIGRNFGYQID